MQIHSHHFATLTALIGLTTVSGMLINTSVTTSATTETASASIEVSSACTVSSSVTSAHTRTLTINSYEEGIGTTKITTICNDPSGYAIYAIGYTNNTYGNTNLNGQNTNINIPTGTATGDVSNWAMRIAKDTTSYNYSNIALENGYGSYKVVPDAYTKVASFPSFTDTNTGSSILTSYAARISSSQAADTYVGKVEYVMVHPSAAIPTPTMQQVDSSYINTLNVGDVVSLTDSRTGKDYDIRVFALNGEKFLMMDEQLEIDPGTVLTPADSNVSANFTLSNEEWPHPYYGDEYYGGVEYDSDTERYRTAHERTYSCKQIMTIRREPDWDDIIGYGYQNSPMYSYVDEEDYYYNWYAATANPHVCADGPHATPTAADDAYSLGDICPKGWRLPGENEYKSYAWMTAISRRDTSTIYPANWPARYIWYGSADYDGEVGYWTSWRNPDDGDSAAYLYEYVFNYENASEWTTELSQYFRGSWKANGLQVFCIHM